ncbi:MAG: 4Fe-4S binding protein [Dehalococcoidia bacterium]
MELKNDRDKLISLANLMNEQSETPTIVTDDLAYVIDAALEPEEVDFLLKMGGGNRTRGEIEDRTGLPGKDFRRILESLLDKGHITVLQPESAGNEPRFHLMSIFPGWFEFYLMRGTESPDRKEFSRRLTNYFAAAQEFPPELLNEVMRETAPHRSITVVNPPNSRVIDVKEDVPPPVNEVYPAHSVLSIFEKIDNDEIITVGHCFCRQQRRMDGDPCRMNLPEEACLAIGPAAKQLIERSIARRISKAEAMELINEAEQKGAVHQAGRLVPLKDFESKYEVDIICNCCWDCCGAFGLYNRGITPFVLKSYYISEIRDKEACTSCGTCEDICPVRAISVGADNIAIINADLCVGCGLCAFHCPDQVIQLKPFERDVFLPVLEGSQRRI